MIGALEFIADNGRLHAVRNKMGDAVFSLQVEFAYLRQPDVGRQLLQEAERIKSLLSRVEGDVGAIDRADGAGG